MNLEIPTTVPLQAYLALAAILFCTGVWGLINSRNAVRVLMSIELMLNAVNLSFVALSTLYGATGQVFVVFVLTVAAAEAAVALAMAVLIYRRRETVDLDRISVLRW